MLHDMSALDLIQHLQAADTEPTIDPAPTSDATEHEHLLIHSATTNDHISPADIRKVLSSVKHKPNKIPGKPNDIDINGSTYRKVNTHSTYHVSNHKHFHNSALLTAVQTAV